MKTTLYALVENHAGVLSKISGMFSRRGFNIHSLAVGETDDPNISRMTIVVNDDAQTVEQIEKQLNKVIPVIKVRKLEQEKCISRMLTFFKINLTLSKRDEIINIARLMDAKILDVSKNSITLLFVGDEQSTEIFSKTLRPYGIKEVVCTGAIAIEKSN